VAKKARKRPATFGERLEMQRIPGLTLDTLRSPSCGNSDSAALADKAVQRLQRKLARTEEALRLHADIVAAEVCNPINVDSPNYARTTQVYADMRKSPLAQRAFEDAKKRGEGLNVGPKH